MRKIFLIGIAVLLQSCYYPVRKDYGIYSRSLVFSKEKKWLINTIQTDVDSHHKEMMTNETLELFNKMSSGNAIDLKTAKSDHLFQNRIPIEPETEDLETLKNNTNFNFLVNIYTFKTRNELDGSLGLQYQYKKNETFATMEIYDIQTMKKIYFLKASSEVSVEENQKATIFTPNTEMMTMKNFRSLLKSIKKFGIQN